MQIGSSSDNILEIKFNHLRNNSFISKTEPKNKNTGKISEFNVN